MSLQFVRIVADENIPKEVVESLRALRPKEVYWIAENKPGISDPEVWRIATTKGAVLITRDLGFLSQLSQNEVLFGPSVVEYSTDGLTRDELRDPAVMKALVCWFFERGHYDGREHVKIHISGTQKTRQQLWQFEKLRRKLSG
jgi:predicted nuclease of predicted toxin-antitoxin system